LRSRRLSRIELIHLAAGIVTCVVLPGYSHFAGAGGLAWTMFARSDSFRLTVVATDRAGHAHLLHPSELGHDAEPELRAHLLGAESFHTQPVGPTFRARLPALARLGCQIGTYSTVEVTLEERRDLDAAPEVTHARATCR
jgi:hypothetical protein